MNATSLTWEGRIAGPHPPMTAIGVILRLVLTDDINADVDRRW